MRNQIGIRHFHTAVERGYISLVKVLLERGADIQSHTQDGMLLSLAILKPPPTARTALVQLLLDKRAAFNVEEPHRISSSIPPLQAAIIMGDTQLIEKLVAAGSDLNCRCRMATYQFRSHEGAGISRPRLSGGLLLRFAPTRMTLLEMLLSSNPRPAFQTTKKEL